MLNVPIDRIVPLTDARDNFSRLVADIEKQSDGMYVLTKGGKPAIALINIEFLNELMNGKEVTISPSPAPKIEPEKITVAEEKSAPTPIVTRPKAPDAPAVSEPPALSVVEGKQGAASINPSWTGTNNPWPLPGNIPTVKPPTPPTPPPRSDIAPIMAEARPLSSSPAAISQLPQTPPTPPPPAPPPPPRPIAPPPLPPPRPPQPAPPPPPPMRPTPPAPTNSYSQSQPVAINKPTPPAPPTGGLPPPPQSEGKVPFSEPSKTILEPGEPVPLRPTPPNPPASPSPAPVTSTGGVQPSVPKPAGAPTQSDQLVKDLEI